MSDTSFNDYAVVDLGSNSFHMVIVKKTNDILSTIYKNKRSIHLVAGLDENNILNDESIQNGLDCLAIFAERLKGFPPAHVRVVATYTLRVAKNKHEFLKKASEVFPYPIEIISGQEEARLIYSGIINNEPVNDTQVKCVIDIGGGSTEVAIGTNAVPIIVESRPMGCVTYAKQFFADNKITKEAFNEACFAAEQQVEKLIDTVKKQDIDIAFGTSGTVKAIYKILIELGLADKTITRQNLEKLVNKILKYKKINDLDFESLADDRQSLFVSGLAIFYGIFIAFDLQELHFSNNALREGLLSQLTSDSLYHQETYKNTIESLFKKYNVDTLQANRVANTAKYLLKQWKQSSNQSVDPMLESILKWASLLHEIGLTINFSGVHKHSAYILQHSNLPGFNEEQQNLLSVLVKYHRKLLKLEKLPFFSLFNNDHISSLLQILRLSVLIHTQRSELIDHHALKLSVKESHLHKLILSVDEAFATENKLIMFDLEQERLIWCDNKPWKLDIKYH